MVSGVHRLHNGPRSLKPTGRHGLFLNSTYDIELREEIKIYNAGCSQNAAAFNSYV